MNQENIPEDAVHKNDSESDSSSSSSIVGDSKLTEKVPVYVTKSVHHEIKLEILRLINEARVRENLDPLGIEEHACEAADTFAQSMVENNFKSHWDLNGFHTIDRYFKCGVENVVAENIEGIDASENEPLQIDEIGFLEKEIKRVHRRMMSEAPDGSRKQHLISDVHTHVGFGIAITPERIRYVEVYINKYVKIEPVPDLWPAFMPLEIKGKLLKVGYGVYGCLVTFNHLPESLTVDEANSKDTIIAREDIIAEIWPWQIISRDDGTFSLFLNIDAQEGSYSVKVLVKKDIDSIPYDYPVAGLSLTNDDIITASVVVMTYDGRPLFVDPSRGAGFVTDIIILNESEALVPSGYIHSTIGEAFPELDQSPPRICYFFDGDNAPITSLALLTADSMDSIDVPADWEMIPVNLASLLCLPNPSDIVEADGSENSDIITDFANVVVLACHRGELSSTAPIVSVKLAYDQDIPDSFEVLEMPGYATGRVCVCFAHGSSNYTVPEEDIELETLVDTEYDRMLDEEDTKLEMEQEERLEREREARHNELLDKLSTLRSNKEFSVTQNETLQKKLAYVMFKKQQQSTSENNAADGSKDGLNAASNNKSGNGAATVAAGAELSKRYSDTLKQLIQAKQVLTKLQATYNGTAVDLQDKFDDKDRTASEIADSFRDFKREICRVAENSRTGKSIPRKLINQFEVTESKKDAEVEKVRLRNINLRTQLKKLEQNLHEKEQLAEGLHLIDFEQLKIENQTLNEKIEERNEELHKLRKKTTTTVQVLTHIKEKLQFIQGENLTLKKTLNNLDSELTSERDLLTKLKRERDSLRSGNDKLRQKQGFVNSKDLVRDYESRKNKLIELSDQLHELQTQHSFLVEQRISKSNRRRNITKRTTG